MKIVPVFIMNANMNSENYGKMEKKLICVLCGQEWGVKNIFTNRCENEECTGFCSWGYELSKPVLELGKCGWDIEYTTPMVTGLEVKETTPELK